MDERQLFIHSRSRSSCILASSRKNAGISKRGPPGNNAPVIVLSRRERRRGATDDGDKDEEEEEGVTCDDVAQGRRREPRRYRGREMRSRTGSLTLWRESIRVGFICGRSSQALIRIQLGFGFRVPTDINKDRVRRTMARDTSLSSKSLRLGFFIDFLSNGFKRNRPYFVCFVPFEYETDCLKIKIFSGNVKCCTSSQLIIA